MRLSIERWTFAQSDARLPEEDERWWRECHLPHPLESLLENRSQWCVLLGGYQSGKSTVLAALRRKWQEHALVLEDDALLTPKKEEMHGNILHRILRQASWKLRQQLSREPEKFSLFSPTQKEFLRWSVEKFHGRRAFARWLDGLPQEIAQTLQEVEFEDIYPSQTSDVDGQIEELVNLCCKLGYRQVVQIVDTTPFPAPEQMQEIRQMLGWLEPMQQEGLKLVAALPPAFTIREIRELTRGRASVFELETSADNTWQIVSSHLNAATHAKIKNIEQLCSSKLITQLQSFATDEFGAPATGAWLKLVEILLEMAAEGKKLPLSADLLPSITNLFYLRFMPLRLVPESIDLSVWRGYKRIPLDRAVYDFLTLLASQKSTHINHEIARTTKNNLHTLASRLRVAIEPDVSQAIYLKNAKGEGYWLENFIL